MAKRQIKLISWNVNGLRAIMKKGYSGVGVYSRLSARSVKTYLGIDRYDREGRILELDFGDFIFSLPRILLIKAGSSNRSSLTIFSDRITAPLGLCWKFNRASVAISAETPGENIARPVAG